MGRDQRLHLGRDALAAIADLKGQARMAGQVGRFAVDHQGDRTGIGELYRIVEQVQQHLPQPGFIGCHRLWQR